MPRDQQQSPVIHERNVTLFTTAAPAVFDKYATKYLEARRNMHHVRFWTLKDPVVWSMDSDKRVNFWRLYEHWGISLPITYERRSPLAIFSFLSHLNPLTYHRIKLYKEECESMLVPMNYFGVKETSAYNCSDVPWWSDGK